MFSESSFDPDTDVSTWIDASVRDTWWSMVHWVFAIEGTAPVSLSRLYAVIREHPKVTDREKKKVMAGISQVLRRNPEVFVRVGRGLWDLTSRYSNVQMLEFERLRHGRSPRWRGPSS